VTRNQTKQPVVPRIILTLTGGFEKSEDKIYRVEANDLDAEYQRVGYQRCERSYKVKYQHSDYTVVCYEYRNDDEDSESVIIIPEFLLLRRPYMLEIYLYAIDLYSSSPEKGQRWAAEETRKKFKLPTFAHTTLGRALKTFVRNIKEAENAAGDQSVEIAEQTVMEVPKTIGCGSCNIKQASFRTVESTKELRTAAARVLGGRLIGESLENIRKYSYELARTWFFNHQRLLL
jgi:hypothetical protein